MFNTITILLDIYQNNYNLDDIYVFLHMWECFYQMKPQNDYIKATCSLHFDTARLSFIEVYFPPAVYENAYFPKYGL